MLKRTVAALLDHFESYLCQFLLAFFVITIFAQIILRAVGHSLHWTEEIARFAFIWFILFGACHATRLSAMNRVSMHLAKAPPAVGRLCLLAGDLIWIVFCLIMARQGYLAVMDLSEFPYHTPALGWDMAKIYLVFPVSFLLMAARIVQVNVIKYVLKEEIRDPDQMMLEEGKQALLGKEESP
jgi:TRAP-type C4-dicarboxylate transport system permease small subunit